MLGLLFLASGASYAQGIKVETAEGSSHAGRLLSLKDDVLKLQSFADEAIASLRLEDLVEIIPVDDQAVPMSPSSIKRATLRKGLHQFTLGYWTETHDPGLTIKYSDGGDKELKPVTAEMLFGIAPVDAGPLKFLRGKEAPSQKPEAWREPDFDDSGWEDGRMPLGYGEQSVKFETTLDDMRNNYRGVFVRKRFVVKEASAVDRLELRGRCDDGYIAWINGVEVDRYNMANGDIAFDGNAERSPEPIPTIRRDLLDPERYLKPGTNVLAFHVANTSRSSSDLVLDLVLVSFAKGGHDDEGFRLPEDPSPVGNHVNVREIIEAFSVETLADLAKAKGGGSRLSEGLKPAIEKLTNHSGVIVTGFVRIPSDGEYRFELESSGYSQLAFGDPLAAPVAKSESSPPPPPPTPKPSDPEKPSTVWLVRSKGGTELRGSIRSWNEKQLVLETALVGKQSVRLEIAVDQLQDLRVDGVDLPPDAAEAGSALQDGVFVRVNDETVQKVAGLVSGIEDDALLFQFRERLRQIKLEKIVRIRLARTLAEESPLKHFHQQMTLNSGISLPGTWVGAKRDTFEWKTLWGPTVTVGWSDLKSIEAVNGRLRYLSNMKPVQVKQTAFFDRVLPFRVDSSVEGGPVSLAPPMKEGAVKHAISVHSRTALTYELNGGYERFMTMLAFQYPEGKLGNVDVRVAGDDKVLFEKKGFKGTDGTEDLDLPVTGVNELTLEVDFGEGQDVGDRIVWVEPRLVRDRPQ